MRILCTIILLLNCILLSAQTHKTILVAHTSDTHSCIEPIPSNHADTLQADKAGFQRRAALVQELRNLHTNSLLLLDCGDFSQGSVYYNLFRGEVEIKLMNQMKYDACLIGNHEFDFGLENLARLIQMANFPFVCSNYDFTHTPCEGLIKPYIVLERAGLRIGILGVSPQPEGLVSKDNYQPMRYIVPAKAAQPIIDILRNREKCDVVICLSHLGWGDEPGMDADFISSVSGIDLLLGGHTHTLFQQQQFLKDRDGYMVAVSHVGKNARYVGITEMVVE